MADIRTTVGGTVGANGGPSGKFPSRVPGTRAGLQINTFGLQKLEGISGEDLVPIMLEAIQPAKEQAIAEWPVDTGASRDSIDVTVTEVGPKNARVALQAGGIKLIEDERNKSHKDYAPYIEYNGTPNAPAGTMTHAVIANQPQMVQSIRDGVTALLRARLGR